MIIDYDHNPNISTDQKLQSLVENLQLAYSEVASRCADLEKKVEELEKALEDE